LLYQASRDGFKASDFHSKVNGIQGTLTIIKTVDNFVFGGYTEADWGSNSYQLNQNSFIFSLKFETANVTSFSHTFLMINRTVCKG